MRAGRHVVSNVTAGRNNSRKRPKGYAPWRPRVEEMVRQAARDSGQDPDAVVVIGFEESSKILRTMVEKGIGPRDVRVYGCDGNIGNALGETYDAGE